MPRFWTHYWANKTWDNYERAGAHGWPLIHVAGSQFRERGVATGDHVYVITNKSGTLYLLGKMQVRIVVHRKEIETVAELTGIPSDRLWNASDHVIAAQYTPMNFRCPVHSDIALHLRLISGGNGVPPPSTMMIVWISKHYEVCVNSPLPQPNYLIHFSLS